ncbi:hypothetical protein M9458_050661, partial [Cirrhinus mrigala]
MCQCTPPGVISPITVQGYADDVQMASRDESVIKIKAASSDERALAPGLTADRRRM